jgi:hypothetical protein
MSSNECSSPTTTTTTTITTTTQSHHQKKKTTTVSVYTREERHDRIKHFKEKKKQRLDQLANEPYARNVIKYAGRQAFARSRERLHGRFMKRTGEEKAKMESDRMITKLRKRIKKIHEKLMKKYNYHHPQMIDPQIKSTKEESSNDDQHHHDEKSFDIPLVTIKHEYIDDSNNNNVLISPMTMSPLPTSPSITSQSSSSAESPQSTSTTLIHSELLIQLDQLQLLLNEFKQASIDKFRHKLPKLPKLPKVSRCSIRLTHDHKRKRNTAKHIIITEQQHTHKSSYNLRSKKKTRTTVDTSNIIEQNEIKTMPISSTIVTPSISAISSLPIITTTITTTTTIPSIIDNSLSESRIPNHNSHITNHNSHITNPMNV